MTAVEQTFQIGQTWRRRTDGQEFEVVDTYMWFDGLTAAELWRSDTGRRHWELGGSVRSNYEYVREAP
jgi:hypothetical protein